MTIIFLNDIFYVKAPIFSVLSRQHVITAFIVILMSITVIAGLVVKPKKKTVFGMSFYSIILIGLFLIGAYINFTAGSR